jgi:hypothetical protein
MAEEHSPLGSIDRQLGEVSAMLRSLHRELERDRQEAREGRARLYGKVEDLDKELSVTSAIAVQARDKVTSVEKLINDELKPQTDKIKNLGIKGTGFMAALALIGGIGGNQAMAAVSALITSITK